MSTDLVLQIVFRWAHILAAVVAVGGTFYIRMVLMPSAQAALTPEQGAALRARLMERWKPWVMGCIAVLLVSGLYNFVTLSLPKAKGILAYHPLFGIKVLAALGIFFLASALTGRAKAFEGMRASPRKWMTINVLLGLAVILISGVLKNLVPAP